MSFFLLDIDYQTRDRPVIRMFGPDKVIEDKTFEPYIYVLDASEKAKARLLKEGLNDEEREIKAKRVKKVSRTVEGKKRDVLQVFIDRPQDTPTYREFVKGMGFDIREFDIPFTRRYLIDRGVVPLRGYSVVQGKLGKPGRDISVADLKVMSFDIETYNPEQVPRPERDPIIAASFADSSGWKKVFTWKEPKTKPSWVTVVKDEKGLLERIVEVIQKRNPDVLVTYNGDQFDFPYLRDRARLHKVPLKLGRTEDELRFARRGRFDAARIKGRCHLDIYHFVFNIVRGSLSLPRYTLEAVANEVLGTSKQPFDGEIWQAWDTGGKAFDELLEYSKEDAEATVGLALNFLPVQMEFSRFVRDTLFNTSRMSSSQMVEALLMNRAFEREEVAPNRPAIDEREDRASSGKYQGAYVKEPEKGLHEHITLFDFRSLYPSLIISHNISPDTINCDCCREPFVVPELGYKFCLKRKGIMPDALEGLFKARMANKETIKKLKRGTKEYQKLDAEIYAQKIFLNAAYGSLGYRGARWYSRECAESATALARHYIKDIMAKAEAAGFKVLYGDTDSLFIDKAEDKEKAMDFLKTVNSELPGIMSLELDGFYRRGLFVTKKRYALIDYEGKVTTKGLEVVRRDWSKVAKDTQHKVLDAILNGDVGTAIEVVRQVIKELKTGKVPPEKLVILTRLIKHPGAYAQTGPHVEAAKKLMAAGKQVGPGSLIAYIVEKGSGTISERAIPAEQFDGKYDAQYYIENQVLPPVLRLIEVLGYDKNDFTAQTKLNAFF